MEGWQKKIKFHLGRNEDWCSYFSGFIPEFNGAVLLVVGDVPVDSKASMVTS
jgi:hypothetical protein